MKLTEKYRQQLRMRLLQKNGDDCSYCLKKMSFTEELGIWQGKLYHGKCCDTVSAMPPVDISTASDDFIAEVGK